MTKGPRKVKLVIVVNKKDPPTFKTLTPTSRTQLKQQLMREQAQEQLRRESLQAQSQSSQSLNKQRRQDVLTIPTTIASAPVHHAVEVPPQVLQVRTVLENPTRYHVLQKQQSQVRQYLSESFQPRQECPPRTAGPILSAPELPLHVPSPDYDFASGSGVLSPEICSVTTSNSENDDFLDDILSLESGTTGLGASSSLLSGDIDLSGDMPTVKQESLPFSDAEIHALAKDRQKKDNHNMIERRRRFNINDRIKELGTLLPKTNDPFYEVIRDVRPNKGTILKSSVDYIKCLREEVNKLKQGEMRRRQTEIHNRKLLLRIQELEHQAKLHGLPVSDFVWQPSQENPIQSTENSPHIPYTNPVPEQPRVLQQTSSIRQNIEPNISSSTHSEQVTDPLDALRLDHYTSTSNLGCLQLDSGANDVMASISVGFLDASSEVGLSPSPSLMVSNHNQNSGEPTSVLNLSQMEDLMDDDSHNPVVQGDPMLCSSPSSRLCLGTDDHSRVTMDSILADDSAILGINTSTSGNSLLVDSTTNQSLTLGLLSSSGLLTNSSLLSSSSLLGPSRAQTSHISDCFSDTDMELGV